jgi:hypothetical protein
MTLTRDQAKALFQVDDQPTEQQFSDFLDSIFFKTESGDLGVAGLKEYNPTVTYIAGMTCIKDNVVYQANSTTSGTWNPSKWSVVFNGILHERVVITDPAIIRNCGGTPIVLLASPGAGLMTVPIKVIGTIYTNGTAFSLDPTYSFCIKHLGATQFISYAPALLYSTVNRRLQFGEYFAATSSEQTQFLDDAALILTTSEGVDPEEGFAEGAGRVIIDLYYIIEDHTLDLEDSGSGSGSGS